MDVKSKFAGAAIAAVLTVGLGSVGLAMAQEATEDPSTTTTEAPEATAPDEEDCPDRAGEDGDGPAAEGTGFRGGRGPRGGGGQAPSDSSTDGSSSV